MAKLNHRVKCAVALLLVLSTAVPSFGWNATGHKAIALLAYGRLLPTARARVDRLLLQHPDYPKWIAGVPAPDRGRAAFLEAATWPDDIRNDPRFHADNARPTSHIPGLPPGAQARHSNWHYMNLPFSSDGTPTRPSQEPNILTKLRDFQTLGSMSSLEQTYLLPWVLHLIGDIHQPLHTMARFDRIRPDGDRGGNSVEMKSSNLHSYWDSRIGTSETDRYLDRLVETIQTRHPRPEKLSINPEQWSKEGFELRGQIYAFSGAGTERDPATMSDAYSVQARETSYARAAFAGYRLADFLNQRLR